MLRTPTMSHKLAAICHFAEVFDWQCSVELYFVSSKQERAATLRPGIQNSRTQYNADMHVVKCRVYMVGGAEAHRRSK